jgi:hypothetical protein
VSARDLFGAAVRLLGVWLLFEAFASAVLVVIKLMGFATPMPIGVDVYSAVCRIVGGLFLIGAANWIVRLVYGREPTRD